MSLQFTTTEAQDTMMDLMSKQKQMIKLKPNLQSGAGAEKFVNKRNANIKKPGNKYAMDAANDYDGDGIADVIVTKAGKLYTFNGYMTTDGDWPIRRGYLDRTGDVRYRKSKDKARTIPYDFNNGQYEYPDDPEYLTNPNTQWNTVKKRQSKKAKSVEKGLSARQAVMSYIAKPAWDSVKQELAEQGRKIDSRIKFISFASDIYNMFINAVAQAEVGGIPADKGQKENLLQRQFQNMITNQLLQGQFLMSAVERLRALNGVGNAAADPDPDADFQFDA